MATLNYVVWRDKHSVGNTALDDQHQKLFEIINLLYRGILIGISNIQYDKTLTSLVQYARVHFRMEEAIMRGCGYPGLAAHQKVHHEFDLRIINFRKQFFESNLEMAAALLVFLKQWLRKHILEIDMKYAPFINSDTRAEYAWEQSGRQERNQQHQERQRDADSDKDSQSRSVRDERYYATVFGLAGRYTQEDIKRAYFQKVREYHPDRVANLGLKLQQVAEIEMKEINEAFDYFKKKRGFS